ncbi:transcriptional regulator, MucR family [Sphingobium sp. AP50]|nr:transcriptional regulator, MucR family [Sphingobium sp. AP50]
MADTDKADLTQLTVQLLSAYVANNSVASEDLATLIKTTRTALLDEQTLSQALKPDYVPAVTIRKSLGSPDHILSLIDGKPYKMLKRHLAQHGLTPDQYRERYGLSRDYPMTAKSYSEARRATAARIGLGSRQVKKAESTSTPAEEGAGSILVTEEKPSTLVAASPRKSKEKGAVATRAKRANATGQSQEPKANSSAPVEQDSATGPNQTLAGPVKAENAAAEEALTSPTQKAQRKSSAKANTSDALTSASVAPPAQDVRDTSPVTADGQPAAVTKRTSGTRKKDAPIAKSASPSSRKRNAKAKPENASSSELGSEVKGDEPTGDQAQAASRPPTLSATDRSAEGPTGHAPGKDIAHENVTSTKEVKPAKRARNTLRIKTQA